MTTPSNFHVDVTSQGDDALKAVLGLFDQKAVDYQIVKTADRPDALKLYWTHTEKSVPLPYALSGPSLLNFVKDWLATASHGPRPDIDGSTERGAFHVTSRGADGHYDGYLIVCIQPCWAEYHK